MVVKPCGPLFLMALPSSERSVKKRQERETGELRVDFHHKTGKNKKNGSKMDEKERHTLFYC